MFDIIYPLLLWGLFGFIALLGIAKSVPRANMPLVVSSIVLAGPLTWGALVLFFISAEKHGGVNLVAERVAYRWATIWIILYFIITLILTLVRAFQ